MMWLEVWWGKCKSFLNHQWLMILKFRALVWACVCLSLQTLRVFMALCKRWSDITTASAYVTYLWSSLLFFPEELSTCATRCKRSMRRCFWRENRCWGQPADLWCRKPFDNRTISRQMWLFATLFPPNVAFCDNCETLGHGFPCPVPWEVLEFHHFLGASSVFFFSLRHENISFST